MIQIRRLSKDDLQKLTAQAKAITEFRPSTDDYVPLDKAEIKFFESIGTPVQKRKSVQKRLKKN